RETLMTADAKYVNFGCSPSINIYDDAPMGVADPRSYIYRFAGGHLHNGLGRLSDRTARRITVALDGILGVATVGMAEGIDNPIRRTVYGRAGEIRLPAHGIEYRVLSNFWLCHPAISMLVCEIFRLAIMMGMTDLYNQMWRADQNEVRRVINECDVN